MGRTADRTRARARAREALAERQRKRREREERMEAAATKYFAAADAIEAARRDAAEAIQALVSDGESRSDIADLLGVTTRDIKSALDVLTRDQDEDELRTEASTGDDTVADGDSAPDAPAERTEETTVG
ncbi:MAG: hypothetical protein ACR2MR_09940 [Dietzia maris]